MRKWLSGIHSTNWNGPVEMLAVLLISFAASSSGMIVAGEVGAAMRSRKEALGAFSLMTKRYFSGASKEATASIAARPGLTLAKRSSDAFTSAEVISLPVWNLTPLRSGKP